MLLKQIDVKGTLFLSVKVGLFEEEIFLEDVQKNINKIEKSQDGATREIY